MTGTTNSPYDMSALAVAAIQVVPIVCRINPATISGRSPIRSASAPAIGPTTRNVAVQGTSRSPAPSAPYPRPVCRNCAKK
jgi:hypothetical protein